MSIVINPTSDHKSNSLQKKSSFRRDGSYRIFHITKKQKESDDDDDSFYTKTGYTIDKENTIKPKYQKKSFKISNRNGLDGWKRKSTKNKRLLFLHKASCESTSNEIKSPGTSHPLTNDLSSSIISNDVAANQFIKKNHIGESLESDGLIEVIDETMMHDDATLNDLLARADKLETTVKKPEFNKIQPLSRTSIHRRRKRFIIACSAVLIGLTILITIVIFLVIMILRYKTHKNEMPQSSSFNDV